MKRETILKALHDAKEDLHIWQAMKQGTIPREWRTEVAIDVLIEHSRKRVERIKQMLDAGNGDREG